jgi:hypothetical protein
LYVDGHEPPSDAKTGKVLIVTEHVTPLPTWLASNAADSQKEAIAGMFFVAKTLITRRSHDERFKCHEVAMIT